MLSYFSCPLCSHSSRITIEDFHDRIASLLTRYLQCLICKANLKGLSLFHMHLTEHLSSQSYSKDNKIQNSCVYSVPSLETLVIRDTDGITNCEGSLEPLKDIYSRNFPSKEIAQHNCEFCGLIFSSDHFLSLHKDLMHRNIKNDLECKLCKTQFSTLESYRRHSKAIHGERRYHCNDCPKSFKLKGGLLMHAKMMHDNSSPTACRICHKTYSNKARKDLHEKRCSTNVFTKNSAVSSLKQDNFDSAKNSLNKLLSKTSQSLVNNASQNHNDPNEDKSSHTLTCQTKANFKINDSIENCSNVKNKLEKDLICKYQKSEPWYHGDSALYTKDLTPIVAKAQHFLLLENSNSYIDDSFPQNDLSGNMKFKLKQTDRYSQLMTQNTKDNTITQKMSMCQDTQLCSNQNELDIEYLPQIYGDNIAENNISKISADTAFETPTLNNNFLLEKPPINKISTNEFPALSNSEIMEPNVEKPITSTSDLNNEIPKIIFKPNLANVQDEEEIFLDENFIDNLTNSFVADNTTENNSKISCEVRIEFNHSLCK